MLAVKNSQKRRPRSEPVKNRTGRRESEEAPTVASWREKAGKLSGAGFMESIYDNVLYRISTIGQNHNPVKSHFAHLRTNANERGAPGRKWTPLTSLARLSCRQAM